MEAQQEIITIKNGSAAKEITKLKIKCNMQLERINELNNIVKDRDDSINLLNTQLKAQEIFNEIEPGDQIAEAFQCLNYFIKILKKIIVNDQFIAYKNYTKNSARFCKVEKTIFDDYLDSYNIDKKIFWNYCIDFALVKAEENRKYIWNDTQDNQAIRIYFISKYLINIINGEYQNAE